MNLRKEDCTKKVPKCESGVSYGTLTGVEKQNCRALSISDTTGDSFRNESVQALRELMLEGMYSRGCFGELTGWLTGQLVGLLTSWLIAQLAF